MAVGDVGGPRGSRLWRGSVVRYEGATYKVLRTREVDGFAMPRYADYEVLLAPLDGGESPGWVGDNEVEPVDPGGTGGTP